MIREARFKRLRCYKKRFSEFRYPIAHHTIPMTLKIFFFYTLSLSYANVFIFSTNSFKCPDLSTRDATKCYYKDKVLNATDSLESSELGSLCSAACYCQRGRRGSRAEFRCAHIDCPEHLTPSDPKKKCVKLYDKEHCCSTKTVCGKLVIENQKATRNKII